MPAEPESAPPAVPARLGRYVTVRRIGAGGMAEVFLARSRGAEGTDKLLAVKRILPAFAANARFRTMFVDEARVALRLNHPNVVQVYGFESDGPSLLLVMEYVDGPDLAALAQRLRARDERMPPGLAAWIVREAARGLHYAHERRDEDGTPLEIVHRDVSPGNVLLSHDGVVKLGDFGIAKAGLVSGEGDEGALKGKFAYMSPEQARTEAVDRRADLYSLGVVLGELVAGRGLFDGPAGGTALLPRLRRGETPDVESVLADAPAALRAIVAQLVAADPAARFASAREVGSALTRFLRGLGEEWDAAALEAYLARYLPRAPSRSPPPLDPAADVPEPATVAVPRALLRAPLAAAAATSTSSGGAAPVVAPLRPYATTLDNAVLMRERVHAAVVVGRFVLPASSVDTVDTRPIYSLLESLAFKAAATFERTDDGRFALVVGVVQPHVDHALGAARLALDIAEAARDLAAEHASPREPGPPSPPGGAAEPTAVGVALGVARAVAACARAADGALLGFEVVDEAVSFASSLADTAAPGEALVTAGLFRLVRRAFVLAEHPHARAVGAARAFRLERAKTRAERERDLSAAQRSLVGREAELGELAGHLARVRAAGAGAGLLVTGELGVGKSALLAAFAAAIEHAAATGDEPAAATAVTAAGTTSVMGAASVLRVPVAFGFAERHYGAVAQVLCDLLAVPDEDARDPAAQTAAVERAVEIAAIRSSPGQRAARRALRVVFGLDDDEAGAESATAREVVLVVRRLFATRAAMGPFCVAVDGLEAADRQSRAVLLELCRRPPAAPVLLVLAARADAALWREAGGGVAVLALAPLAEPARRALVARALAVDEVAPELLREVSAVAGGNPLMVLEVVEALADRGRLEVAPDERGVERAALVAQPDAAGGEPGAGAPLPATLEEVLAARIDALPPEARVLLRFGALVDAELPTELLHDLGGDDAPRALARLVSDGILVRARGRRDLVGFAHAALARVARASIDPTQLPGMHARVASLLERLPSARGVGAAAVARHREAAGARRPAARAYLECAGALKAQSHHGEALAAYGRVLALTADGQDPEVYALRYAAHAGREEVARSVGRPRARRGEIVAMRRCALESRDARLIARALVRQARYKLETQLGTGIERDVLAATRAARRAGELRTEAEAKRVLAVHLGQCGRYAEAIGAADEALAALETRSAQAAPPGGTAEDGVRAAHALRVELLLAKGALLRQTGETARAIEVYAHAWALLSRHGPRRLLAPVLNSLGVACIARGDHADALRLFLASIAVHRETGQRDRLGQALANAGQTYAVLGQTDRAFAFLRKALDVYAALGARAPGAIDARVALAELHAQRGATELALAELERAREALADGASRVDAVRVRLGEAVVALARGEHAAARASAEDAERLAAAAGLLVDTVHARAYAAEACAMLGNAAEARRHVDAVLADPLLTDPMRIDRAEHVLGSCERALRALGEVARAQKLATLRARRSFALTAAAAATTIERAPAATVERVP